MGKTWKEQYDDTPTYAFDMDTALLYTLQGAYDATGNKVGLVRDVTNALPNVRVATTTALNATYNNGTSGVGATLTNAGALAALLIDGVSLSVGNLVLVCEQAAPAQNGVYSVTTVGSGAVAWKLTRHASFNNVAQMRPGRTCAVYEGDNLSGSVYVFENPQPATIGTDPLNFNSMLVTTLVVLDDYLPLLGGTMTGDLFLNADPTSALQAVTKQYADNIAAGLNPIPGVVAASTATLNATYLNGTSGVGATLTNAGALAAFSLDGQSPTVGQRVLIKNQSSTFMNGIYTVGTVGSGAVAWQLVRSSDYDTSSEISPGDIVFIENGTVNAGATYYQSANVVTIGTDPITFSAFFTPATYLKVANNLSELTGTASTARSNIGAAASGANADITSMSGLTGALRAPTAILDSSGLNILAFSGTASAVNYFTFRNSAAGSGLFIEPTGSDASIALTLYNKNSAFFLQDSTHTVDAALHFNNAAGTHGVTLSAPSGLGTDPVFYLPSADGTAGQVLSTNASGALSFGNAVRTVNFQTFPAGAFTYTASTGCFKTIFISQGAGGGSGGTTGTASQSASGGSGGGGGCLVFSVTGSSNLAAISGTVGTHGNGGASGNNNGTAGTATTVTVNGGTTWSSGGGGLGNGQATSASAQLGATSGAGGTNTVGTNGTLIMNIPGQAGSPGTSNGNNAQNSALPRGGSSHLGIGGAGNTIGAAANSGSGYGAGASGQLNVSGSNQPGANGQDGILIAMEFCNQ